MWYFHVSLQMFVRTMSGVFGRIATVLPTLTPDVLPSLSRKDSTPEAKVMEVGVTLDEDNIELNFGIIQQEVRIKLYMDIRFILVSFCFCEVKALI